MKTCEELANRWNACQGGQILVDHSHPLKLYLNVNEENNKELLVPVSSPVTSFHPTEAIGVKNYRNGSAYFFAVELKLEKLTKEFVCLCFDLIESSRNRATASEARETFFETFKKWYSLWTAAKGNLLSIQEIRGLMGELKYILDEIISGVSETRLIDAWTTHKDASRDFVFDNTWDEIKTVKTSGDYITISSLEQLEHDSDGRLIVYRLDKVDTKTDDTYTLNGLVEELKDKLGIQAEAELCRKLLIKGYVYDDAYDAFVFRFTKKSIYSVNETFPRIGRDSVPSAVFAARYDLLLSLIEDWREK